MAEEVKTSPINLESLGEFIRGEITLQELHQIHGDDLMDLARAGEMLFAQGQLDQAQIAFEGLTALNPHIGHFHTALGCIYFRQQKKDEALTEYSLAIEKNPNDIDAYANRGELRLTNGDIEGALNDLNQAISLDPQQDVSKKNPVAMRALTLAMALKETITQQSANQ
ncbi:MAG: tetratricopeptide repeat protein [bacterium]